MNERIKNLLSQASIYDGRDSLYWCEEKNLTEFAELIVKECVKEMGRYEFIDVAMREVKEHFGVK
jgi:hypothetical protein